VKEKCLKTLSEYRERRRRCHVWWKTVPEVGAGNSVSGKEAPPSTYRAHKLHLVTGRSPSLVHAPGTTYLTQSENHLWHS